MILEISLAIFLCLYFIYRFLIKKRTKQVRFVGCRSTGKTTLINFLANRKYKTVPTLEKYSTKIKDSIIEDIPECDGDLLSKYSIDDPNYQYFFFVKDFEDYENFKQAFSSLKTPSAYDLKFVITEGEICKKQDDLICLNGDYKAFEKML
ncbi:hypothetical protein NGRA_2085 [Nosema granulosis]|uniref:G domain-containing protein n=1 Tax=Nosema granulosis TaxID=83296 RepID=A0A9P6H009_9MICR|nr:hypothetical protein NGRA_2085 [Nosema granulosis]